MSEKGPLNGKGLPLLAPEPPKTFIYSTIIDPDGSTLALFIDGRPYGVQFTHNGLLRIQCRDLEDAPVVNMTFADLAKLYHVNAGRQIIPPGVTPS